MEVRDVDRGREDEERSGKEQEVSQGDGCDRPGQTARCCRNRGSSHWRGRSGSGEVVVDVEHSMGAEGHCSDHRAERISILVGLSAISHLCSARSRTDIPCPG